MGSQPRLGGLPTPQLEDSQRIKARMTELNPHGWKFAVSLGGAVLFGSTGRDRVAVRAGWTGVGGNSGLGRGERKACGKGLGGTRA